MTKMRVTYIDDDSDIQLSRILTKFEDEKRIIYNEINGKKLKVEMGDYFSSNEVFNSLCDEDIIILDYKLYDDNSINNNADKQIRFNGDTIYQMLKISCKVSCTIIIASAHEPARNIKTAIFFDKTDISKEDFINDLILQKNRENDQLNEVLENMNSDEINKKIVNDKFNDSSIKYLSNEKLDEVIDKFNYIKELIENE